MVNAGQKISLTCRRRGRGKDRIVTANIANNFRPPRAIKRKGYALRCANGSLDNEQIRSGWQKLPEQIGDAGDFVVGAEIVCRKCITAGRSDRSKFFQVTADARLRCMKSHRLQLGDHRLLGPGRPAGQQATNRFATLRLDFG